MNEYHHLLPLATGYFGVSSALYDFDGLVVVYGPAGRGLAHQHRGRTALVPRPGHGGGRGPAGNGRDPGQRRQVHRQHRGHGQGPEPELRGPVRHAHLRDHRHGPKGLCPDHRGPHRHAGVHGAHGRVRALSQLGASKALPGSGRQDHGPGTRLKQSHGRQRARGHPPFHGQGKPSFSPCCSAHQEAAGFELVGVLSAPRPGRGRSP